MAFLVGDTVALSVSERGFGTRPRLRGVVIVFGGAAATVLWENGLITAGIAEAQLDLVGAAAAADLAVRDKVVRVISEGTDSSGESDALVLDVYTRAPNSVGPTTHACLAILPHKQQYLEVPFAQISVLTGR